METTASTTTVDSCHDERLHLGTGLRWLAHLLAQQGLGPEQVAQGAVDLLASLLDASVGVTVFDGASAEVIHATSDEFQPSPVGRPALRRALPLGPCRGRTYSGWLDLSRAPGSPPFDETEIAAVKAAAFQLGAALGNLLTGDALAEAMGELTLQTVHALVRAAEMRDQFAAGHSARVSRYAVALARSLGLDPAEVESLRIAALLHDVGKVGVSDQILSKPGPLTPDEWMLMREHPTLGCQIVQSIRSLAPAIPLIMHHQEHYDGHGYPGGLSGEQIPAAARILAVADAFEAITATRAYRPGRTVGEALRTLADGAGGQWDGALVTRWLRIANQVLAYQ